MKRIIIGSMMAFLSAIAPVHAQEQTAPWSLEACINYAYANNIQLKQKMEEQEARKVELHTSKHSWLPAVNANMGQSFQFRALHLEEWCHRGSERSQHYLQHQFGYADF